MIGTRERATIERIRLGSSDLGMRTCTIIVGDGGWVQAMPGPNLTYEVRYVDYCVSLVRALHPNPPTIVMPGTVEELVGTPVWVLRCFKRINEPIEGLESLDGRRFTITSWYRKFEPLPSPLERRIRSIKSDIQFLSRRLREQQESLATLGAEYVNWEVEQ